MSASRFCPSCAFSEYHGFAEDIGTMDDYQLYCGHPRSLFSDVGSFDTCSLFKPANDEDVSRDEIDEGFDSWGVR